MDPKIVRQLGAVLPPRPPKIRFPRVTEAHAEIQHLEMLLGLPPGRLAFNIFAANLRVAELTEQLARKTAQPTPAPTSVPAVIHAAAAPVLRGRERQLAATKIKMPKPSANRSDLKGRDRFKAGIKLEGQKNS